MPNSHVDIAMRRKLAAELVAKVINPNSGPWTETRAALVDGNGKPVAILPVAGWSYAGAQEVATMLGLSVSTIEVTVTHTPYDARGV